jgi:Uma2 family endonuclease
MVLPVGDGPLPRRWRAADGVLLAIEILSPGSAHADRQAKRRLYQRERIPEYWIVDLDARLIERWRPDDDRPEIVETRLEWTPPGFDRPCVLDVADLFARVWRD